MVHSLRAEDPRDIGGYRIEGRLGTGGMGVVYLGTAPDGRQVAVKVVRAEFLDDMTFRSRFRREVEAAAMVRGRHLARLVAAAPDAEDPWLATEYVPGPTLVQAVQQRGPLPDHEVRELVTGLVEALRAIHAAGLVHRDLKPANVILGPSGPTVIDLGVAHVSDATAMTGTGLQLGTPMFMAPEQAVGEAVTPAVDVWGLGAVTCFAATGTGPFGTGQPTALLYRVVHDEPQLDDCPPGLRGLIAACLAKDPAGRPGLDQLADAITRQSGLDLPFATAPALPDAGADEATSIRTLEVPGPAAPVPSGNPAARRGVLLGVSIVAGLLLAGGIGTAVVASLANTGDPGTDVVAGPASQSPSDAARGAGKAERPGKPSGSPSAGPTTKPDGGPGDSPSNGPGTQAPPSSPTPASNQTRPATNDGGSTKKPAATQPSATASAGTTTAPAEPTGPKSWTKGSLGIEVVGGGSPAAGKTLHITSAGWSPALVTENTNCSWRWTDRTLRSGTSSSCSYTLTSADAGHQLVLYITAHQDGYHDATGSATSPVVQ
ncbi:protein kinase domain-containing protein [Myceligenerans crystallogenes]|uniref:Protein kinase domain-containing protein n=1 Tax=Myceligenerans crystallogenes TaxID=316335 RepID=A0ABN2N8X4_9MICO